MIQSVHNTLSEVGLIDLKSFEDHRGTLVPIEGGTSVPFEIKRLFYIYGVKQGERRGDHAHKICHQIFLCLKGAIEVTCDDGLAKRTFLLDSPKKALSIPASIWAAERYVSEDAMLLVLTDQPYDAEDYIRKYDEFLEYRKSTL